MKTMTPFEIDIAEQPAALLRLANSTLPDLNALATMSFERIIFTGMGSSDYASVASWRQLVALGRPVWTVDTGQLLENLGLITPGTLLIITSQSGASGETQALLNHLSSSKIRPELIVGISDNLNSSLGLAAEVFLPLLSGDEATVSTKSYLNTLAVHRSLSAAFKGESRDVVNQEIFATAKNIEGLIGRLDLSDVAEAAVHHPQRRLAYVGRGNDAATAKFAALITKESSKVPAEGFVGGQFRHGPFELAGKGLTVVMFGLTSKNPDESLERLSRDLIVTGSSVVIVGDYTTEGAITIPIEGDSDLEILCAGTVVAELLAVALARANGVVPGKFLFGHKITKSL
jgi:glucosamine--fructose-6-phosphate aminotransferase (isomerizing)